MNGRKVLVGITCIPLDPVMRELANDGVLPANKCMRETERFDKARADRATGVHVQHAICNKPEQNKSGVAVLSDAATRLEIRRANQIQNGAGSPEGIWLCVVCLDKPYSVRVVIQIIIDATRMRKQLLDRDRGIDVRNVRQVLRNLIVQSDLAGIDQLEDQRRHEGLRVAADLEEHVRVKRDAAAGDVR